MNEQNPNKKPASKSACFWIIVAVILIGLGVAVGSSNDEPQKVGSDTGDSSSEQASDTKKEFAVGDIISINDVEIVVTSVERNYKTNNSSTTPLDGKEYIRLNVQIQNKSKETVRFSGYDWKVEDSNGVIEDMSWTASYYTGDSLDSGELATGGTKKGSIVFEVPVGDTGLRVHYSPSIWSSKEAVIRL